MICKSMRKELPVAVPFVQMKQASFAYELEGANEAPSPVLQNVDLSVRQGECVVLCGRSGCGKTTLLRLVNGLVPHFYQGTLTGEIRVNGLNTAESGLPEISRIVGSVFQNPRTQFFHTDTTGEMAFNLENQAMPREQMQQRLRETADQLELDDLMGRNIFELSGGEKQQIACGSVYASMPDVVVMDEPSSNLDMPGIQKLQNNIRAMKEAGKTILISEHRLWYLEQIADRYLYLENGQIAREFSPEEIVRLSSKEREAMGLRAVSQAQLLTACNDTMVEREWNENGLEAQGLTFSFGERQVLNVRHLVIPKGAIVAVIGENGAGKSTLALCIAGVLKHHGTVKIEGKTVPVKKLPQQAYLVMQEAGHQMFSDSVLGEVMLNQTDLTEGQAKQALTDLGLSGLEERHPASLSGGQQQRLSIAVAQCSHRKLMLYDEPTSGQDGENLINTVEMIRHTNETAVCSMIVSHDPELILRCATHILHIHGGEVKKFLPMTESGIAYMWKVFGEESQTHKAQKTGIPRLLEFTGRYRSLLTAAQILSGVSSLFLLGPFLCVYFAARELLTGLLGGGFETAALLQWGLLALGTGLIGLIINFVALLLSHRAAFYTEKNLKISVLRHLAEMPLGYFEENPSGKLRKIIDENGNQVESYLAHQLPDLVGAEVTLVASAVLMLALDWRIGLPLLVLILVGFALQFSMMGEKTMSFMKRYQDAQEEMNHEAVEYVRGISVIKVFGQSVHSMRRFQEAINAYREDALRYTMACKPGYVGFNTVINSSFLVLIPTALICLSMQQKLPVAGSVAGMAVSSDFVTFTENYLFYLIFTPACAAMLNKIMYMMNYKMQAVESMRRLDTVLLAKEQRQPKEPTKSQGSDICFEHVTFTYPTGEKLAITDVSFTAKAGTTTAVVGHSGSGKTTIASLIPRFYDVQEGAITIGGVSLPQMSRADLSQKIAFVFQNPKLLKATLEENVRMGCIEAGQEEIMRALHLAQCDDILRKLPDGLHTMIGTKGVYLSGGEVQRVAIARAILKDAPIIVLDEATAFANPENEAQIQLALRELTRGKTVIMIAHRLSTTKDADQILVMKNGKIIERGVHDSLLSQNGDYAHMWQEYHRSVSWKIHNTGIAGKEGERC